MAELDPQALSFVKLFADSREAVLDKGGEVWQALRDGLIEPSAIAGELRDIAAPHFDFSRAETDITVWKSVGFAELDLITAEMILNGRS
jgi:ornithine cyclodeaminase/alanine dehydrogenase-like protein (mu-crystallin family)